VDNRLSKIETALASMQDLRGLSELLSVQYNPFLEAQESSPEARHTASELILRHRTTPADPLEAEPGNPGAGSKTPHQAGPAPEDPSTVASSHASGTDPAPARPSTRPTTGDVAHSDPAAPSISHGAPSALPPIAETPPSGDLSLYGRGLFSPSRPAGGPRETFLAIHWFTYLAEGTDPSIIFVYLDYYRAAGWFGETEFSWLENLARGLARRRAGAAWSDYGLDAKRLAQSHLRNLRVLDKLFGATLQYGEAQYLQQTLDALLGDS
jgi:hypothetical protein